MYFFNIYICTYVIHLDFVQLNEFKQYSINIKYASCDIIDLVRRRVLIINNDFMGTNLVRNEPSLISLQLTEDDIQTRVNTLNIRACLSDCYGSRVGAEGGV
jgi:hypothetical protein